MSRPVNTSVRRGLCVRDGIVGVGDGIAGEVVFVRFSMAADHGRRHFAARVVGEGRGNSQFSILNSQFFARGRTVESIVAVGEGAHRAAAGVCDGLDPLPTADVAPHLVFDDGELRVVLVVLLVLRAVDRRVERSFHGYYICKLKIYFLYSYVVNPYSEYPLI